MEDNFQKACDTLSNTVDNTQFERFRWTRDEQPKLARMVELLRGAFEDREDFDLAEEGATGAVKRFVIKIHGQRTIAIAMSLQQGQVVIQCEPIERSRFTVNPGNPISDAFEHLDERWMEQALQLIFARIRPVGGNAQDQAA